MTPEQLASNITPEQRAKSDRLNGLPYVCLVEDQRATSRIACRLRSGERMTVGQVEEVFNAGLLLEALEGEGAAACQVISGEGAAELHHEMLKWTERLFGISIQEAFPIYLTMQRYSYSRWEHRPRVKWVGPVVN